MSHREMLEKIGEMVAIRGETMVLADLLTCGVPVSTADKIVRGEYWPERLNKKTVTRLKEFFVRVAKASA